MDNQRYIGLLSGTSLDHIDAGLFHITDHELILIDSLAYPFPSNIVNELKCSNEKNDFSLTRVAEWDHQLGHLFSDAVLALLDKSQTVKTEIAGIGSHGQTILHAPSAQYPFTVQIGDPNIIALKTGITTVADFRRKDIAAGGQGAPFAPVFHQWFFGNQPDIGAVINIGGIANITFMQTKASALRGFDCGPGNCLLDAWILKHRDLPYDENGLWAASGQVNFQLLSTCLTDPYFSQPLPKSTGRDYFNLNWLETKLAQFEPLPAQDVQATLIHLTALTIASNLEQMTERTVICCGGGVKNSQLMSTLRDTLPQLQIKTSDNVGLPADWVEAGLFAWLGKQTLEGKAVDLSSITGAKRKTILGGIYYP